ncbi:hypothetical protein L6164_033190 [Bauhinia variegata]|uniref:Uncharacterized protein n=1 Tax=Bauhinia variegata TaxID=167791 RepID=A0ACB9KR45_BAUVA|nr:hypothetical protein L6164_033190 [Bauhinia variegata]
MATPLAGKMELRREDQMLTPTTDRAILKQVLASHTDHVREFDVFPVINLTEQILIEAIECSTGAVLGTEEWPPTTKRASGLAELDVNDTVMILRLSRELSGICAQGYAHEKTMELLNILSGYSWHAKVALALSGFAVNFGKFCLSVQPSPADALSMSLAQLRELPNLGDLFSPLKCHFDKLKRIVRASLDITKCIAEIWNLSLHYISEDKSDLSDENNALIHDAVYWTIKSVVTSSSQIDSIKRLRNEYIPSSTEANELSTVAVTVDSIREQLKNQLDKCYQYIEQRIINQYLTFSGEDNLHMDHMDMRIQRRKHMLLLISDLSISEEEVQVLKRLYKDQAMRSERLYEMVWVPIEDELSLNFSDQCKFKKLKSMMPWYSFQHPLSDPKLTNQIKEDWNLTDRLIVVVQDPQGKVSSKNAIHMMWIWGNSAFPFSREREEDLWTTQIWNLETVVDHIDPRLLDWMKAGRHICLYGSDNLEWIRKFTKTMSSVASTANIPLKMVYVGKGRTTPIQKTKKQIQSIIATIAEEKLSHSLPNYTSIWFFWERLEAMLVSKLKQRKTAEDDRVTWCLMSLLTYASFDRRNEEWAIFFEEKMKYSSWTLELEL